MHTIHSFRGLVHGGACMGAHGGTCMGTAIDKIRIMHLSSIKQGAEQQLHH